MSPRKKRSRPIHFEALEPRQMLANGVTASMNSHGLLKIVGTNDDDRIFVRQSDGKISVKGISGHWSTSRISAVRVDLRGGDDYISLNSKANGGRQDITEIFRINSGGGQERVRLAGPIDIYFKGTGHQLVVKKSGVTLDGDPVDTQAAEPPVDPGPQPPTPGIDPIPNPPNPPVPQPPPDAAGITVTPTSGLTTSEAGAAAAFSVVLNSQPTANVTIGISTSNAAEGTVSTSSLVFTPQNWNTAQTVTVTGVNDAVDDGNVAYTIRTGAATSADANYSGLNALDVSVSNTDNDTAGITVTPTSGLVTTEAGGTAAFTVKLNSQPTANVTIGISTSNAAEGTVSTSSLVFTPQNWNTAQTVTVTGVNDAVDDGNVAYTIRTGAATSADANYNGLDAADVAVTNNDDDPTPTDPDPPTWFDENLHDAALISLAEDFYDDGKLDRTDMISIFQAVAAGGVSSTEFTDLTAMVTTVSLFGSLGYVQKLSSYIVQGNSANAKYQGATLGNLAAGSTAAQLGNLVNKWFLGLDRPTAGASYSLVSGSLFVNGAAYTDVAQGSLNDCAFLASLAETALRSNATITSMFIVNGDGTYTVRFYHDGVAEFVTVDSYLPAGGTRYARVIGGELWVALAEKAYAQAKEMSWFLGATNSYSSIEWQFAFMTLENVTGQSTTAFTYVIDASGLNTFATAYNAGELICVLSKSSGTQSGVVANHAYAVIGYNSASQTVTLFNPWGVGSSNGGILTLTWTQIQSSFQYFDRTI
ncbi:MAG: hypothetical protein IT427_10430 [Pirellulales bacterium]|nr:hypothetical protein [Pirellulales bacterium]